jgi:hypothetical protein
MPDPADRVVILTDARHYPGRMRWAALLVASLLAGCTSSAAPQRPPSASSLPPCTGRVGEAALRGFFSALGAGRPVTQILDAYVVPQNEFVRWWDDTLGPGHEITGGWAMPAEWRDKLRRHLEDLQHAGMKLVVDEFTDVGFQGNGFDAGGWFNLRVRGQFSRGDAGRGGGGKGAADCAAGRLEAVVLG